MQVSQVTSGPRRGPTFNNRWWNDRREWNLRTSIEKEKASPKGANHIQSCFCSPPSGTIGGRVSTIRRFHSLRSFHQRLFTFAPFGDGRMPHAKVQYFMFCSFSEEINLQIFFRSHKRPWLLPGRCGLSPRICRRGHPSCSCPQSACLPWSPLCRNPRACRCDRRP